MFEHFSRTSHYRWPPCLKINQFKILFLFISQVDVELQYLSYFFQTFIILRKFIISQHKSHNYLQTLFTYSERKYSNPFSTSLWRKSTYKPCTRTHKVRRNLPFFIFLINHTVQIHRVLQLHHRRSLTGRFGNCLNKIHKLGFLKNCVAINFSVRRKYGRG